MTSPMPMKQASKDKFLRTTKYMLNDAAATSSPSTGLAIIFQCTLFTINEMIALSLHIVFLFFY
jgi:hypothetical protein